MIGAFLFQNGVMILSDKLLELLQPIVAGLDYELLGIERLRGGEGLLIRVFIDHDNGISAKDCELVSRHVSDVLDVEDAVRGGYTLEMSSPGINRPLFTLEQHSRYVGESVKVRMRTLVDGRRRVKGTLSLVSDNAISVTVDGETLEIPFEEIERSNLVNY